MKIKKRHICIECGYVSSAWLGKCPECNSWNSFEEEVVENLSPKGSVEKIVAPIKIQEVKYLEEDIYRLESDDINNFFGDGIVPGSVVLLAGEPGVGKSTFLFLLAKHIERSKKIYYFSGEESVSQIKKRFDRVGASDSAVFVSNISDVDRINDICNKEKPTFVFIDSIQTCYSKSVDSSPGTISQIKKCNQILIDYAKNNSCVVIVVCHVTKSGEIAGPKFLEHMVDVVVYFETDYKNQFRALRSRKNRYGNIDEILLFEMEESGLEIINNPSAFFIDQDTTSNSPGKCKSVLLEGKQPLIVEVEALVVPSSYPNPKRFSEGIDLSRLNRIIAIIDKHLGENLSNYDIYFNILGGIKTSDIGLDFAIAAALFSSKNKKIIKNDEVFIGELSLTGKVKKVFKQDLRKSEAIKFGYSSPFMSEENSLNINILKEIIS